jgi:hypothetical protein
VVGDRPVMALRGAVTSNGSSTLRHQIATSTQ